MQIKHFLGIVLAVIGSSNTGLAQYFGRNKANYENHRFEVCKSPHFDLHHYMEDDSRLAWYADYAERWYQMHQRVLYDTLKNNPVILYNDHADFQQTRAISGEIGVGTGGVTEAFKNRVVLPWAMSNQQSIHVLGHELVHAFQYKMILEGDSTNLNSLANIPLWMVEGLAEYLSIGRVDAHTAMWMRDAVLRDKVPTLEDLNNPAFFPYRYGQAFWAFLTGLKGDQVIAPFFKGVAMYGFEGACQVVLGMSTESLSKLWTGSLENHFGPFVNGKTERFVGKKLISDANSGEMNISPSISPNGKYIIFLSEKNVFSIDLFLAEYSTGKVIRKVTSTFRDGHLDDLNYIESAGTWSPKSDQFAFVGVNKGNNVLVIKDVENGRTVLETTLPGVPAFSNPAWSPDGRTIVVNGLVQGQVDLYSYDIKTKKIEQLTNDVYSEMLHSWSEDGSKLVFSTDQRSVLNEGAESGGRLAFGLGVRDMVSGATRLLDVFPGADNLNPVFDQNNNIIFLSNRDGFRNAYRYDAVTGKVFQLTEFVTGISGITQYAPALTIDRRKDNVAFSYFSNNQYDIYKIKGTELEELAKEVDPLDVDFSAATLPTVNQRAPLVVDQQIAGIHSMNTLDPLTLTTVPYKPNFRLDYIGGGGGLGVSAGGAFGTNTGLAGGIDMLFGDMLGNNQLFTTLSLNGEITDAGGVITYVNQKGRLGWGGSFSHVPFRNAFYSGDGLDTIRLGNQLYEARKISIDQTRLFQDQASGFVQFPFSTILRAEAGASFSRYSYRIDRINNYYDPFDPFFRILAQDRERLDAPQGFNLGNLNAALVGDNSFFGLTSPLAGHRFRLGVEQYYGEFSFLAPTADFRYYYRLKPVTFAVRAYHYGRYGNVGAKLSPLFLGFPWFVRGYEYQDAEVLMRQAGRSVEELFGDKIGLGSFEIRLPFTGPKQLAVIKSGFLLTDLNLFFDGGIAFDKLTQLSSNPKDSVPKAVPVSSLGASIRINLFGAMILEPYYAKPLIKNSSWTFGLNIQPGW